MPRKPTKRNGRRRDAAAMGSKSSLVATRAKTPRFTTCILRSGQLVPDRMVVPMKFAEIINMNGAAGVASYVWSVNSAYDPNVTSTGGSVTGFQTLGALYGRYRVYSSKIRITSQGGNNSIITAAIAPSIGNPGTSVSSLLVAQYKHAKPHAIKVLPVQGYGPGITLDDHVSVSEMLGDALYDDDTLYGTPGSDPATQFYWTLGTVESAGAGYTFSAIVELEYLVEWSLARDAPA